MTERLTRRQLEHAGDLGALTFAHRLTYTVHANWKAVVDNFLECYHCPVAHRDFVSLVEMDTYERGRYLVDPDGSGLSEHGVHHFHGMVLEAYRRAGAS